jgi:hypothetical protein
MSSISSSLKHISLSMSSSNTFKKKNIYQQAYILQQRKTIPQFQAIIQTKNKY